MDTSQTLLEFRRTGGRAHQDERLVVGRDGRTVRALDSALPAELLPLVKALNVLMQRNDAS